MYLFIDTETGGFKATEHSLLTLSAIVTDKHFNIMPVPTQTADPDAIPGCLYLRLKSDQYSVTPQAMAVNKIDLVKHAQIATEPNEARQQFVNFITAGIRATGVRKLIPAGHNVKFDMRFIWHHMLAEDPWGMYCTYPEFDTAAIARYLNSAGKISGGCSLSVLRERFGIHTGGAHDAEVDNLATIELAKKFMEFLPPVK